MSKRESLHDWLIDPAKQVWLANWRAWGLPYCSVYVIAPEGNWPSKIGISTCAKKRVEELQTSHWKRLVVVKAFWCSTVREARLIEQKSHATLKDENVYLLGEWFDKKPDQASEIVEFAAMTLGIELHNKIEHDGILGEVARYAQQQEQIYRQVRQTSLRQWGWKAGDDIPINVDDKCLIIKKDG